MYPSPITTRAQSLGRGRLQQNNRFRVRLPGPPSKAMSRPVIRPHWQRIASTYSYCSVDACNTNSTPPNHIIPLVLFSVEMLSPLHIKPHDQSTYTQNIPPFTSTHPREGTWHFPDIPLNNSRLPTFSSRADRYSSHRPMPHSASVSYTTMPAGSG